MKPRRRRPRPPEVASRGRHAASPPRSVRTTPPRLPLERIDARRWRLLPTECARARDLDLDDARAMRDAGELDIARDELLYLVSDCRGFLAAHNLLAEIALEEDDVPIAQGHFGFAYETVLESLPPGFTGQLPADAGYNAEFFRAGCGLARCLIARGAWQKGQEVLDQLLRFDADHPLARDLRQQLQDTRPDSAASQGEGRPRVEPPAPGPPPAIQPGRARPQGGSAPAGDRRRSNQEGGPPRKPRRSRRRQDERNA